MTTKITLSAKNVTTLKPSIYMGFFLMKSAFKNLQSAPLKTTWVCRKWWCTVFGRFHTDLI